MIIIIHIKTKSIEQRSWESYSVWAGQEIPCLLWNQKFHYSVHKSPPLDPILSHLNPVHNLTSYLRSILILSSHFRLLLQSVFPLCYSIEMYTHTHFPVRAACPFHILVRSTNYPAPHYVLFSYVLLLTLILLGQYILLATFSKYHLSIFFPLVERPNFTPIRKNRFINWW